MTHTAPIASYTAVAKHCWVMKNNIAMLYMQGCYIVGIFIDLKFCDSFNDENSILFHS